MRRPIYIAIGAGLSALAVVTSHAAVAAGCPADHDKLEKALKAIRAVVHVELRTHLLAEAACQDLDALTEKGGSRCLQ